MNILLVSSYLPYPLDSGGHVRLFNIIKQLSKKHEITLICEMRSSQTESDIDAVKKYCRKVLTVPRKKQWTARTIAKTGMSRNPFLVTGHTHPEMRSEIEKEIATEAYDLIHVETFYVLQNVPDALIPIVLVEHNIEWVVYNRFVSQAPFSLRPLLKIDVEKLKRVEHEAWDKVSAVVAVSETEQEQMQRPNVFVVPNGVDTKLFDPSKKKTTQVKKVLFIGNFSWIQNKDSIEWIVKDIWPSLVKQLETESVKLWIVGKNMPEWLSTITDTSIIVDKNNTQSTEDIFADASILLAPIRVGAGTQYKILEAMASGVPIVTTQVGAVGLKAMHGKELLIGETAEIIAKLTVQLLTDKKLSEKLEKNGRKLVEENFTWEAITEKLEEVYSYVRDSGRANLTS